MCDKNGSDYDMDLSNLEMSHYIIIGGVALLLVGLIIILFSLRRPSKRTVDVERLYETLNEGTIQSVSFVRNKINVTVKRPRDIDMEALKDAGAVGVNVVGKKIKFYFETDNEAVYQSLLETMEERQT
mgnify:CR=1 FL=1